MTQLKYDHFKQTCQEHGFKPTVQRYIIFSTLLELAEHPTADLLFERVKPKLPGIGRDTVYRTLNSLAKLGLVSKVTMPGGATHFDGDVSAHHHFLCQGCDRIFDLVWSEFNRLPWPESVLKLGRPQQASVLISGICRDCGSDNSPDSPGTARGRNAFST